MSVSSVIKHPRRISIGLLGVLVLLAPVILGATTTDPASPQIQAAVRGAITDAVDAGTYKDTACTSGPLAQSVVQQMHATLASRLAQHMTGRALAHWRTALDIAINRDSDGQHVIVTAGGTDQIEFSDVTVSKNTATAVGRAHTWVTWVIHDPRVPGPHSARPSGWSAFSAALVLINGTWYVEQMSLVPEGI